MTTLYVSNLPEGTSEEELRDLLEEVGGIRYLTVNGKGGRAVCDFFDPAAARVARRNLDGNEWQDSVLEVRYTYELSLLQRQQFRTQVAQPASVDDSMDCEETTPCPGAWKEGFESEVAVKQIMENLPGLNVDIRDEGAVSEACAQLDAEEVLEILHTAQDAAMIDEKALKEVMVTHPGLTRGLFAAQLAQDLLKVPEDRGAEVEILMHQLLSMLKPKKNEKEDQKKSKSTGTPVSVQRTPPPPASQHRHPRNLILPSTNRDHRSPAHQASKSKNHRRAPIHSIRNSSYLKPGASTTTAQRPQLRQTNHPTEMWMSLGASGGGYANPGGANPEINFQGPQQMLGLAQEIHQPHMQRLASDQIQGQVTLQTPPQQQQLLQIQQVNEGRGSSAVGFANALGPNDGTLLAGVGIGGNAGLQAQTQSHIQSMNPHIETQQGMPSMYQQHVQPVVQYPANMTSNQVVVPNQFSNLASSQASHQGWIMRPQGLPTQQCRMVLGAQGMGLTFQGSLANTQGGAAGNTQLQAFPRDNGNMDQLATAGWIGNTQQQNTEGRFRQETSRGRGRTGRGRVWYR